MSAVQRTVRGSALLSAVFAICASASWAGPPQVAPQPQPPPKADAGKNPAKDGPDDKPAAKNDDQNRIDLDIKLPRPAFKGTPKNAPPGANLEPPRKGPRPPLRVPKGTVLLSAGKPVTASDKDPIIGSIKCITDGDKEAREGSFVEFGPGLQWVQIDLKERCAIQAIALWHYHSNARIYRDVVVRISDDPDFVKDVHTVFNNDHDNSAGLGLGADKEFWETYEGKLIDANGVSGRYVRLYSKGNSADDQNQYTEVEVYGLPAGR